MKPYNDILQKKHISLRGKEKETPQWIIWPISQTIHFVKTPPTKLHEMVTCQGRKCGKKPWSFTTQPLFPGHPNPILPKGSRTQFSFEETIIVFLQQQTPTIHPAKSSPVRRLNFYSEYFKGRRDAKIVHGIAQATWKVSTVFPFLWLKTEG